ncbi:hypothetical protein PFICI_13657 [Pestalotiopsis fici W106-1]|uniref:Uncharacterized protein n=1 Tax=Pestalotiopsis fici (strain W106-1 / CGMCC3.15140) TaxID=1229662 RepID=W3WMT7_PESFW|nr:uncharacterized protein PFICI_13657 [Pestalotiopsis fici W106-1]ETS75173.1 hypothetical protein PFICI_13657 [Pestalotiopsis fici W106-1]
MSTTTTTSAAAANTCTANIYDTPVQDAVCAMPYGGNHTDIMAACCKSADVISYYDNCGLYCQAQDQSVQDLRDCLFDQGAGWTSVFCSGNLTATATVTDSVLPTSAGASIVASGTGGGSRKTGSSSSSSSSSTSSGNAAPRGASDYTLSTLGLTLGALLFSATALGAFAV